MAVWRAYGIGGVMVSAGVLITGLLWHERVSVVVRGEDAAETNAGYVEHRVAYLTGTNLISGSATNPVYISSHITIADIARPLEGMRAMMKGVYGDVDNSPINDGLDAVYWLDDEMVFASTNGLIGAWDYGFRETYVTNGMYLLDGSTYVGSRTGMAYSPTNALIDFAFLTTDCYSTATNTPASSNLQYTIQFAPEVFSGGVPITNAYSVPSAALAFHEYPSVDYSLSTNRLLWGGTNNLWTHDGYHSNSVWQYESLDLIVTNLYGTTNVYNYFITTNKLNDAKKIANLLKTTVMYRAVTNRVASAGTRAISTVYDEASHNASDGDTFDEMAAGITAGACTVTTGTVEEAYSFLAGLASTLARASYYAVSETTSKVYMNGYPENGGSLVDTLTYPGYTGGWIEMKAYCQLFENVILDYPSAYAVTNGYVSRVRVYAVTRYSDPWGLCTPADYTNTVGQYTYVWDGNGVQDFTDPSYFSDKDLGTGLALSYRTLPAGYDYVTRNGAQYSYIPTSRIVGDLVLDVSNPSSVTNFAFTFGTSALAPSAFDWWQEVSFSEGITRRFAWTGDMEVWNGEEWITMTGDWWTIETSTAEWMEKKTEQVLSIPYFLVVVDWNWKHLNDANPYVPTPYTPEWARTNSP